MRIHACICNTQATHMTWAPQPSLQHQTEGKVLLFTSVREELCVYVLKCLLIHHTTGTFLRRTEGFQQIKSAEQDFWHGIGLMCSISNKNLNYILKPTVEDLQLLFGEVCLSL